jgi:hypothetical protein
VFPISGDLPPDGGDLASFFDTVYTAVYELPFNHWDPIPDTSLQTVHSCLRQRLVVTYDFSARGHIHVQSR